MFNADIVYFQFSDKIFAKEYVPHYYVENPTTYKDILKNCFSVEDHINMLNENDHNILLMSLDNINNNHQENYINLRVNISKNTFSDLESGFRTKTQNKNAKSKRSKSARLYKNRLNKSRAESRIIRTKNRPFKKYVLDFMDECSDLEQTNEIANAHNKEVNYDLCNDELHLLIDGMYWGFYDKLCDLLQAGENVSSYDVYDFIHKMGKAIYEIFYCRENIRKASKLFGRMHEPIYLNNVEFFTRTLSSDLHLKLKQTMPEMDGARLTYIINDLLECFGEKWIGFSFREFMQKMYKKQYYDKEYKFN
jgi:hypothetical protein